ncbi:hypothetical protein AtubIFM55763_004841 [Aspergillus tubingensis]|uniref:Amidohydrolase n=2 Tax=Aspergillus subgen. Circumdati TaxID=2720871 RepID=A0A100IRF5_ASPNG|nr:amidohydrolase [Aspergillus tubingensis]GAQ45731.1 amidohydrolase [Aspergillus niger]GFN11707.1 amidohydrolase [Aspergillus tubingensis]GLA66793.1 hypothetical protein AtubIFM54640_009379 [Aspergillus tubingensis]GLA73906.1 hypothetical protein AtubIFM55763_004841 [Aspergillus tubingensis]GLA85022.1 hypothetical protein AtubIFM56815_009246 [Aspergillus tubingensis]
MAVKEETFIPMYRTSSSGRPRGRTIRQWQLPICAGICAAAILLVGANPRELLLPTSATTHHEFYTGLQQCYDAERQLHVPDAGDSSRQNNPRWNPISGQATPVVLQNATLFDGESTLPDAVDIVFEAGVITSIVSTGSGDAPPANANIIDVHGKHVTPGLVDMHSHHLVMPFPQVVATSDVNEKSLGPITHFVRAIDGFTPSDPTIKIIASGGVTSSLVLPGSANIVGGEAYPVKNLPFSGEYGEPVIEELLLEHGIPEQDRQRYLKMACGENPKRNYQHTRMGLAWLLREKLAEAQELEQRQAAWCRGALEIEHTRFDRARHITRFLEQQGRRPESFELDTFVALIRGELNVNVHCYTPEDLERMLAVLHEFGIHPRAFHHALEAWQVPELLKRLEPNITVATFADNALYKAEAYEANLRAGKILNDHGVRVAYKSDHTGEENYAKYLLDQASIAHSFGLPADKALQSVTLVPAQSMQQDHRIGYVRPGYDADIVIWDSHPLQVGATAVEVFIDGRALLQKGDTAEESLAAGFDDLQRVPETRPVVDVDQRINVCSKPRLVFTGIQKALIGSPHLDQVAEDLVLVLEDNKVSCLGAKQTCIRGEDDGVTEVALKNGYITPGLIAFGNDLGIQAISSEESTGDGSSGATGDLLNEGKSVHFAKYGAHLHGVAFDRARIGGVTKAITPPHGSGLIKGVSVGLRTDPNATILDGGVWRDDVALHFSVGQGAKDGDTSTVASEIQILRQILKEGGKSDAEQHSVYAQAANGSLPLVVETYNEDDISQLILVKREFPSVNLIIYGGHGAALVAKPLAEAGIPVILTGNLGAPDKWEKKNALPGPPLSDSSAEVLIEAGVQLGLALRGDSRLHGLAREARWAAKQAGLSDKEAVALVSSNIERILRLDSDANGTQEYTGDLVLWDGNPLRGEGSVVVAVREGGEVVDCWPDSGN